MYSAYRNCENFEKKRKNFFGIRCLPRRIRKSDSLRCGYRLINVKPQYRKCQFLAIFYGGGGV